MSKTKKVLNTSFGVMLLTFLMKGLGFVREIVLSHCYGATEITDAYSIALTIPTTLFEYITFAIGISFIPVFTKIAKGTTEREAFSFSNSLSVILICFATLINAIIQVFTQEVVFLFASGFTNATAALAIRFTKIISWNIYFLILSDIFSGFLQSKNKFSLSVLSSVPYDFCIIASIIFSTISSNIVLAYGVLLASVFKFLFMLFISLKNGYEMKTHISIWSPEMKEFILLALPTIAVVISEQLNTIVDRTIASGLIVGGISMLSYSDKVIAMIRQVLARPLGMVLFPKLCRHANDNNVIEFRNDISKGIKNIIYIISPITVIVILFSNNIIQLLFGHGAFTADKITATSSVFMLYAIGLIGYSCREILSRSLYALHDTKTPMYNSIICVTLNIVLNGILSKLIGINGLALATALAGNISCILMWRSLNKKIGRLYNNYEVFRITIQLVLSLFVMISAILLINTFLSITYRWILSSFIGMAVYLLILRLCKFDLIRSLIS